MLILQLVVEWIYQMESVLHSFLSETRRVRCHVSGRHSWTVKPFKHYLAPFEDLLPIDLTNMKLSVGLNDFQRFLARRIYFATLSKLPVRDAIALRIMAFLSPTHV